MRSRSRTLLAAVLVVLEAGAMGCRREGEGSKRPPDDAGTEYREVEANSGRDLSAVDVCDLIPAEAVAHAMGESAAAPPSTYDPGFEGKGCRYRAGRRYAEISLLPPGEFESRRRMRPTEEVHPVAGLGDAAYWDDGVDRMQVFVLKAGDVCLWVRFQERGKATRVEEARRLAEAVLARLP